MYAIRIPGEVYHLVPSDNANTLCGLRVPKFQLNGSSTSALHRTSNRPASRLLCKHCARLNEESRRSSN